MSLIVDLDFPDPNACRKLLQELKGLVQFYKIGSELFTAEGWRAVDLVHEGGGKVFLDLKLHDIPTTVARTSRIIAEREIFMFNVHALGGLEMMKKAREGAEEGSKGRPAKPLLVAVTILTSHDASMLESQLGIGISLEEEVARLAVHAQKAGLDGVVSSPWELPLLRKKFGPRFVLVTPGIRPEGSGANDQARSLTPREAQEAGATYLVVGRPITAASDPRKAALDILHSLA